MSINLLPDALAEAQRNRRRKRIALLGGIAVLFIAVVFTFGTLGYRAMLETQKKQLNKTISLREEELTDLEELESSVVDISKRSQVLDYHFNNVKTYSLLLEKLLEARVTGVKLTDVSLLLDDRLSVVGSVQTYDSLTQFLDQLLASTAANSEEVFVSIDLKRVTSDPTTGRRDFDLNLEPNKKVYK